MTTPRCLTKTRFALAVECPTKLFYTGKNDYANQKLEDQFLLALAEGGFQVGELAKCYFPGGHNIETLDYAEALDQTNRYLARDQAIIFEAAVKYDHLFIRADVLVKNGSRLELIEVKAKSFDASTGNSFYTRTGAIQSKWKPYLYDVAFQKYVLTQAFPGHQVSTYLMLTDKGAVCPTEGLNQKFKISRDRFGRKKVIVADSLTAADLSPQLLCKINVDEACNLIHQGTHQAAGSTFTFGQWIDYLATHYLHDDKITPVPSKICSLCEFKASEEDLEAGRKCGFRECWSEALGWQDNDFTEGSILDVWNLRIKEQLLKSGRARIGDITEADIYPQGDGKPGLSGSERQWLQVQKCQNHDSELWIDRDGLRGEMATWRYPLHFIDFETAMVAIPFNRGRRPYEGIAFQFSHHTVTSDGVVAHADQYLNAVPGEFPNYPFLRCLREALGSDEGSIFRYAPHENTFLNIIYRQLADEQQFIPDREELMAFIRSISTSSKDAGERWCGERNMIDLWALVKRYYYDPETKGSNSIKQILPSVLKRSKRLQQIYGQPIYGASNGIRSLNFSDWAWVEFAGDTVIDPYKLLPKMFQDIDEKELDLLSESDEIAAGGAATTAYARLQFEDLSAYERREIEKALLKYCELDTLAMVMIVQGWEDLISC